MAVGDIVEPESAVGQAYRIVRRRADHDVPAHVAVDVADDPEQTRLLGPIIDGTAPAHALVERDARRQDVDVVRLVVLIREPDDLADLDGLDPRLELEPTLIHERDLRRDLRTATSPPGRRAARG